MPLTVGSRIAHYDVTALIGEGGMGQVYRDTQMQLGRDDAVFALRTSEVSRRGGVGQCLSRQ